MMAHPAHVLALGVGSGLSPLAPGTAGTLWAWVTFGVLQPWLGDAGWLLLSVASLLLGWWACSKTARDMGVLDPSAVVWDEIAAFWLVLWLIAPASWGQQLMAFALFRLFDASKWGPVGWADRLMHDLNPAEPGAWGKAGWGIMFDDYVAAFCTLLVMALWRAW
jgi:phosphatidylglycerophosphatase A